MTYRDSIFDLCKKIENEEVAKELQLQLHHIKGDTDSFSNKALLLQSVRTESDFLGILLFNEVVERKEGINPLLNSIPPLNEKEKTIFYVAHNIMLNYFNSCLNTLSEIPLNVKLALNPYTKYTRSLYQPMNVEPSEYIDLSILEEAILAFSKTSISALVQSESAKLKKEISKLEIGKIIEMFAAIEREFGVSGFEHIPSTVRELDKQKYAGSPKNDITLLKYFFLCYCLKESLLVSMDTIAMALRGKKMGIIDETSIISISKDFTNIAKKGKEFLLQPSKKPLPSVGNICVINYSIPEYNVNVHEFGYCVETRYSIAGEFRKTLECKVNIINEDLNQYNFVEHIYS